MSQNLSSAAVVIGALRVKIAYMYLCARRPYAEVDHFIKYELEFFLIIPVTLTTL